MRNDRFLALAAAATDSPPPPRALDSRARCRHNPEHGQGTVRRWLSLRSCSIRRARRAGDSDALQLLDLHQEGFHSSDRSAGGLQPSLRPRRVDDLRIQYEDSEAPFLSHLRDASLLRTAIRSRQDRRERSLPRRCRFGNPRAQNFRRQELGTSHRRQSVVAMTSAIRAMRAPNCRSPLEAPIEFHARSPVISA
jgi:hypothetical protein